MSTRECHHYRLTEFDAGVPREWADSFARLQCAHPLEGFTVEGWQTLIDDAGWFLNNWASIAIQLGWTAADLFGLDPIRPAARVDQMGLCALINGREVFALTEHTATLKATNGSTLTYYRKSLKDAVPAWDLIEQCDFHTD